MGGPQAGIILGKAEYIQRMKKNPMSRALRIDKLNLAGLEGTLRLYIKGEYEKIPVLSMLLQKPEELKRKAKRLSKRLRGIKDLEVHILREFSACGGGAMPELFLETYCVGIRHKGLSTSELERRLRNSEPPIVARVKEDMLLLDVRTLSYEDMEDIIKVISRVRD